MDSEKLTGLKSQFSALNRKEKIAFSEWCLDEMAGVALDITKETFSKASDTIQTEVSRFADGLRKGWSKSEEEK